MEKQHTPINRRFHSNKDRDDFKEAAICCLCMYWDGADDARKAGQWLGYCRYNAPHFDVADGSANRACWPRTSSNDWCGQFEDSSEWEEEESAADPQEPAGGNPASLE
jgi:hypothetical protein